MHNNNHYAKTVFDLSQKTGCITKVQNQLISIKYLFTKVPAFRLVLITKRLDAKSKAEIINNTLTMFDALILEFLSILIYDNQIKNLLNIISRFNHMVSANSTINKIDLIVANKLEENEMQTIAESLCKKLSSNPKINIIEDSNIIGGMKLRIGNKIFDNSISYQINELKKTLHNM